MIRNYKKIIDIIIVIFLIVGIIFLLFYKFNGNRHKVNYEKVIDSKELKDIVNMKNIKIGEIAMENSSYTDKNNDIAIIPKGFKISEKEREQVINTGLVVIGNDGSEFVWVPTIETKFERHNYSPCGDWYSNYELTDEKSTYGYYDEIDTNEYINMKNSVLKYGGFYIGRYETSKSDKKDVPLVKKITTSSGGKIWTNISPQNMITVCNNMYDDNDGVRGFLLWGINFDTVLNWLVDTNTKTEEEISVDSSSWGNYTNNTFTNGVTSGTTGMFEETKANNIYDLAGNYWEWTQERYGDSYVMRSGGYNLMGGACYGSSFPAAFRDPLPGNNHHPNVSFRVGLYLK